jgi:4-hydroxythreonine-4-phosphate dehydrogenase
MEKLKIGITHGYTNGVSYEVILKTFEEPTMLELCTPIVYGSPKLAIYHRKTLELSTNFTTIQHASEAIEGKLNIKECFTDEVKVELNSETSEAENAMQTSLENALTDYEDGHFDVLVSAPGDKLQHNGLTILINQMMRIASVTETLPLTKATLNLTSELILEKLRKFNKFLKRDFLYTQPRIAIMSLNPIAGKEEEEIITPAIEQANEERICAFGPYTAEQLFGSNAFTHYDGILAMYHDQAQTPFNLLTNDFAVVYFANEERVHTTTLHGAELQNAGKGITPCTSFTNATYTAIDIYRNRQRFDEAYANPLPKLFHDKREDNRKNNIE